MADSSDKPLLDFVSSVSGDTYLKVEEDLGEGFVRLNVSEAQRRQAKHDIRSVEDILVELLRNARDAGATRLFIASSLDAATRRLTVIDDGQGIPLALQPQIFEPRVTSKLASMVVDDWGVHGRGMALYSISANADSCSLVASGPERGAAFAISVDTRRLKERADQSSWPKIKPGAEGFAVVSGPRNLLRTALEFACQHPDIEIYFGSPAEIAATLRRQGAQLAPDADPHRAPVWLWPALAGDGAELYEAARDLGLALSERNAYRIQREEIAALPSVAEEMRRRFGAKSGEGSLDIYRDARGLKVAAEDLRALQSQVESAFEELAEKYYLQVADEVKIRVTRHAITIRLPFMKED
ncbi:MAG: sensor histidine kinase [Actinomycetia bacterium]|nr:sensor histidine kinase [Actinomycetes bacterium]